MIYIRQNKFVGVIFNSYRNLSDTMFFTIIDSKILYIAFCLNAKYFWNFTKANIMNEVYLNIYITFLIYYERSLSFFEDDDTFSVLFKIYI